MSASRTFSTGQIAREVGLHPNTIRMYEAQGLMPPIERKPSGYRRFNEYHLEHLRLLRQAFMFTWLSGAIRSKALEIVAHSVRFRRSELLQGAAELRTLVDKEQRQAEAAVKYLEEWAADQDDAAVQSVADDRGIQRDQDVVILDELMSIGAISQRLDISIDSLRNWERNGLLTVPRDPATGYRQYGTPELNRLLVIKGLRRARFSMNSILRMLRQVDGGRRQDLGKALDLLPDDEEDIFYSTDRWLSKIQELAALAVELEEQAFLIHTLIHARSG